MMFILIAPWHVQVIEEGNPGHSEGEREQKEREGEEGDRFISHQPQGPVAARNQLCAVEEFFGEVSTHQKHIQKEWPRRRWAASRRSRGRPWWTRGRSSSRTPRSTASSSFNSELTLSAYRVGREGVDPKVA